MQKNLQTGLLPIGVERDGVSHREFTLRPGIMRDSVEAIEELGADAHPMRLNAALIARQLLQLGSLPLDDITTDLVLDLCDDDWAAVEAAREVLAKKQKALSAPSASSV